LKIWKRKKKRIFLPIGFGLVSWPGLIFLISPAACAHARLSPHAARFPFPPFFRTSRRRPSLRAVARSPPTWRWCREPTCQGRLLPPHASVGFLSFFTTDRIRPPQSLPSFFRAPLGYIFRARAPLRSILPWSRGPSSSRGGHTRDTALAARLSEPRVFLVSSSVRFDPWWVRIDVLYHLVSFFRELMLCIAR
jgi:hypothetical protein